MRGDKGQGLRIGDEGITLIELLVVIAIVGVISLLASPEIGRFNSNYKVRSCATDLIQNMRLARAMAIRENREYIVVFDTANQRYMIGFDGDNDNNLITVNSDTFGFCKDRPIYDLNGDGIPDRGDGIPDTDTDANGDGIPDCVKVINLSDCGNNIIYGYTEGTKPPNGPNNSTIPDSGVGFTGGDPPRADFNPDGSAGTIGSIYLQQTTRGYSYCVRVSNNAGATNMWKWDGDKENPNKTTWTELR
ncbi:MAG: GspH/FimT family pseudopilin [Candidatus Aenigmatarchaeota archaeon]